MILGDSAIRHAMEHGDIKIKPIAGDAIGPNSVDLHLSPHLIEVTVPTYPYAIDTKAEPKGRVCRLPYTLVPGVLYLGSTVEWTSCGPYAPMLEGTSGAARLGISVHCTAGVGDVGFFGHWTLEITVAYPTILYGGEAIAQIIFHTVEGIIEKPYGAGRPSSYSNNDPKPQMSRLWKKPRFLG